MFIFDNAHNRRKTPSIDAAVRLEHGQDAIGKSIESLGNAHLAQNLLLSARPNVVHRQSVQVFFQVHFFHVHGQRVPGAGPHQPAVLGPFRVFPRAEIGRAELDFEGFGAVAENVEDGQELVGLFGFLAVDLVVERVADFVAPFQF